MKYKVGEIVEFKYLLDLSDDCEYCEWDTCVGMIIEIVDYSTEKLQRRRCLGNYRYYSIQRLDCGYVYKVKETNILQAFSNKMTFEEDEYEYITEFGEKLLEAMEKSVASSFIPLNNVCI